MILDFLLSKSQGNKQKIHLKVYKGTGDLDFRASLLFERKQSRQDFLIEDIPPMQCRFLGSVFRHYAQPQGSTPDMEAPLTAARILGTTFDRSKIIINRSTPDSSLENAHEAKPKPPRRVRISSAQRLISPIRISANRGRYSGQGRVHDTFQGIPNSKYSGIGFSSVNTNFHNVNRLNTFVNFLRKQTRELRRSQKLEQESNENKVEAQQSLIMDEEEEEEEECNDNNAQLNKNINNEQNQEDEAKVYKGIENTENDDNDSILQMEKERMIKHKNSVESLISKGSAGLLKPTTPSSLGSETVDMNDLLDRLIHLIEEKGNSNHYANEDDAFNHIFAEVIKQYFIECGEQGELLSLIRNCFIDTKSAITNVSSHYNDILQSIYDKTNSVCQDNQKARPELEEIKKHTNHLNNVFGDLDNEYKELMEKSTDIIKKVNVISSENADLREQNDDFSRRIIIKSQEIDEIDKHLEHLTSVSTQYTKESVSFGDNLKIIEGKVKEAQNEIEESTKKLQLLKDQISKFDNEIEILKNELEKHENEKKYDSHDAQVDLISRELFHFDQMKPPNQPVQNETDASTRNKPKRKAPSKEILPTEEDNEQEGYDILKKIREQFARLKRSNPNEPIIIETPDDFDKIKEILFEHDDHFQMEVRKMEDAEDGVFEINGKDITPDCARLFATRITKDIINNAIRKTPTKHANIQTLSNYQMEQMIAENNETSSEGRPTNSKSNGKRVDKQNTSGTLKNRHLNLSLRERLSDQFSDRPAKSFQWIIGAIRELYNAKEIENKNRLQKKLKPRDFSSSIIQFADQKFSLDFVKEQYCWDVNNTSHELRQASPEIDIFVSFIDNEYNSEQLAFFLIVRNDCIRNGSSTYLQTKDQKETYSEYFIPADERLEDLLKKWWQDRYKPQYLSNLVNLSIPRPSINFEATTRYVAMHDILQQSVINYFEDTVERLKESLKCYRIIPRLNLEEFVHLVRSIIPSATMQQVLIFYRLAISKGSKKYELNANKFIDLFSRTSLLFRLKLDDHDEAQNCDINQIIRCGKIEYNKIVRELTQIISYLKSYSDKCFNDITTKSQINDIERLRSALELSLNSGDAQRSCFDYFKFLFSLDIIFSSIDVNNISGNNSSLELLESAVQENFFD